MAIHGVYFPSGVLANQLYNDGTLIAYNGVFAGSPTTSVGTMSVWFRSISPANDFTFDNSFGYFNILHGYTLPSRVSFYLWSWSGQPASQASLGLAFNGGMPPPTDEFDPTSSLTWIGDGKWHHILFSWDTNYPAHQRIATFTIDRFVTFTGQSQNDIGSAFSTNYATVNQWYVGEGGNNSGHLAELWFAPGQYLDVTDPNIINKFVTTAGTPTDLGTDGSIPTGTQPLLYLSSRNNADEYLTNRGSGGGPLTYYIPGTTIPLVLSDRDPSIEEPITVITGQQTTATMYTGFIGVTADADASYAPQNTTWPVFNSTTEVTVAQTFPSFDPSDSVTLRDFSVATLHDNGLYDTATVSGTGAQNFYMSAACSTSATYTAMLNSRYTTQLADPTFLTMSVFPLGTLTISGPHQFVSSAWMTANFTYNATHPDQDLRYPMVVTSFVWWNGKEQCIGLLDVLPGGGNAAMLDAAGNMTDARIWAGFTEGESFVMREDQTLIATIADGVNNRNYFFILPYQGGGAATIIIADATTGATISRKIIHADTPEIDNALQGGWASNPGAYSSASLSANQYGFNIATYGPIPAPDPSRDYYLLHLDPACTSYTLYQLIPADGDDTAYNALAHTYGIPVADASNIFFVSNPSTVLWTNTQRVLKLVKLFPMELPA